MYLPFYFLFFSVLFLKSAKNVDMYTLLSLKWITNGDLL